MAGDWIKMRIDLADDPAVIAIANSLGIEEDAVVGKLHRIWSWADRHTIDGITSGVNASWVDRFVGCKGFSESMQQVQWLVVSETQIEFPGFDKHNGESAKRRVENTVRKRLSRKERDNGVTGLSRDLIPRPFARHVAERDQHRCVYCGTESTPQREASGKRLLSIDHIIPASRGGKTVVSNLACCCKLCNAEKNDRTPDEWGMFPTFLSDGVVYRDGTVTSKARQKRDKSATREEKRREEDLPSEDQNTPPPPANPKPNLLALESEFVKAWNATPGVVRSRDAALIDNRRKAFRARIKNAKWNWKAALEKFPLKCFEDEGGWRPDLDWFLKDGTVTKILEGKYDWKKSSKDQAEPRTPTKQEVYNPKKHGPLSEAAADNPTIR